jgi:hypothetical protein
VAGRTTLNRVATVGEQNREVTPAVHAGAACGKRTRVLVGAAAVGVLLVAGGADEGGIECVHILIITATYDMKHGKDIVTT